MNSTDIGSGWGGRGASWGLVMAGVLIGTALILRSAEGVRDPATSPAVGALPVGSIVAYGGPATAVPESQGWMLCDGRELAAGTFPELYSVVAGAWGRDSAGARFRLPDLRGRFLRGVNYEAPEGFRDPDRLTREASATGGNVGNEVGSLQGDDTGPHVHPLVAATDAIGTGSELGVVRLFGTKLPDETAPMVSSESSIRPAPGAETRPRNVYVNWIIRVR